MKAYQILFAATAFTLVAGGSIPTQAALDVRKTTGQIKSFVNQKNHDYPLKIVRKEEERIRQGERESKREGRERHRQHEQLQEELNRALERGDNRHRSQQEKEKLIRDSHQELERHLDRRFEERRRAVKEQQDRLNRVMENLNRPFPSRLENLNRPLFPSPFEDRGIPQNNRLLDGWDRNRNELEIPPLNFEDFDF